MANLTQEILNNETTCSAKAVKVDFKFKVVVIPVSDADRAKEFYASLEWRFDIDSGSSKQRTESSSGWTIAKAVGIPPQPQ